MIAQCGSTSRFSRYRENIERSARRVRLHRSASYHPASTATTGQESTVTVVIMIRTAAQCSKNATIAARYGVTTCCPLIKPHAKLLQQLPRTCTHWAATRLLSSAAAFQKRQTPRTIYHDPFFRPRGLRVQNSSLRSPSPRRPYSHPIVV